MGAFHKRGLVEILTLPEAKGRPPVEEILGRMRPRPGKQDEDMIRRAYKLAEDSHKDQKRKSGDPYIMHPARVAWLLADLVNDPSTIAAGLLHDVIEDCGVTYNQLKAQFSVEVADLVEGVTKISSLNFSTARESQVATLRKMILAMASDVRVVLIKLCDRLHNMLTLDHLSPQRQKAIAQSTMDIYAPLANRLGMARMRVHLEDLSMQYLHPAAYARLNELMATTAQRDMRIVQETRQTLQEQIDKLKIPITIQGRRKHLYSLFRKMAEQGISFEEVHDVLAIRVIANSIGECYEVLGVVHSLWKPLSGRFKDYIAAPKENGYRSIHTSVIGVENRIIEIQIRTREMHDEAEEGIAAHWRYKEGAQPSDKKVKEEKRLVWLRQLVGWLKDVHDPSEFMRELKRDVFEASIFCYTPKGDIIEMPKDSTALDLAYRIHTQLGHTCCGARVNNRMDSIRTVLQTGDVVDIIASKAAHPTTDWLQFATTGRARNKIRHYLKERQREQFLEEGPRQLMEAVRSHFGSGITEAQVREILEQHLQSYNVPNWEDLMVELGCGTIKITNLIGRLDQVLRPPEPRRVPRQVRRARGGKADKIIVQGMDDAVTRVAQCCSPLPGDPIIGFITQGRGVSVHREDCPSLERTQRRRADFDQRMISVYWGAAQAKRKKVVIRLMCEDRKGLLSDVSAAVTQMNHDIVGANTSSNLREKRATLKLQVLIGDTDDMNALFKRLEQIPGVLTVTRVMPRRRKRAE